MIEIGDASASELKGYISRCRLFIGARTHATIAAYSSCVPTLVVGYSVKAKGIAKDLFGTEEEYVSSGTGIAEPEDLIEGFEWLLSNEKEQKNKLESIMPSYREKAAQAKELLKKLADQD